MLRSRRWKKNLINRFFLTSLIAISQDMLSLNLNSMRETISWLSTTNWNAMNLNQILENDLIMSKRQILISFIVNAEGALLKSVKGYKSVSTDSFKNCLPVKNENSMHFIVRSSSTDLWVQRVAVIKHFKIMKLWVFLVFCFIIF